MKPVLNKNIQYKINDSIRNWRSANLMSFQ